MASFSGDAETFPGPIGFDGRPRIHWKTPMLPSLSTWTLSCIVLCQKDIFFCGHDFMAQKVRNIL